MIRQLNGTRETMIAKSEFSINLIQEHNLETTVTQLVVGRLYL